MDFPINPKLDELRDKANSLVEKPGVYLMKDSNNKIIYIGKAKRLKHRVVSYFRHNKSHNDKVKKMVSLVDDFDYIIANSEYEALVLECSLIKQYSPKYNILLKDDKGYNYIKVTNEDYPRIKPVKQKLNDNSTYLGPYTSSVKQLVDEVNKIFTLPTCNRKFPQEFNKSRPCLNYHIKNCSGICLGKTSKQDYSSTINEAISYLKNGSINSIKSLEEQMLEASENLEFERAAKIRDRLIAIKRINQTQIVLLENDKNQDFIGIAQIDNEAYIAILKFRNGKLHDKDDYFFNDCYSKEELIVDFLTQYYKKDGNIPKNICVDTGFEDIELYENYLSSLASHKVTISVPQKGEKKKIIEMAQNNALELLSLKTQKKSKEIIALNELSKLLGLNKAPEYIESYDISNIGNDYMVAGMIVFENAKPKKSAYKKFSIKENLTQDDYACMREVIKRRFSHYLDEKETDEGFKKLPDLILLDGGKTHVSAVVPILQELNIDVPVFGMVKDSKHKTRAIAVSGGEIQISTFKSAFRLVTQIQDEVHRFAITYQRKKHKKNIFTMEFTSIKGIGDKKALALLKYFKTKKAMKEASLEQLKSVGKLSEQSAHDLYKLLHS